MNAHVAKHLLGVSGNLQVSFHPQPLSRTLFNHRQHERLTSQDFPSLSVALIIFNATTSLESGSFAFHTWRARWQYKMYSTRESLGYTEQRAAKMLLYQSAESRLMARSSGVAHAPKQLCTTMGKT